MQSPRRVALEQAGFGTDLDPWHSGILERGSFLVRHPMRDEHLDGGNRHPVPSQKDVRPKARLSRKSCFDDDLVPAFYPSLVACGVARLDWRALAALPD